MQHYRVVCSNQTVPSLLFTHPGPLIRSLTCWRALPAGYFTSRPSTKLLSRAASGYLRAARQLQLAAPPAAKQKLPSLQGLTETVARMQHHDAVTGTDRFVVNQDYRRLLAMGAYTPPKDS